MIGDFNLSLVLQVFSTFIMIIGVVFGLLNIRQFQASRRRESAIMMLNSFQTSDFVKGLLTIFELPDDASKADLDQLPPEQFLAVYLVIGTWERLGILVYRREIDLDLVEDAFSGPIVQSWRKLEKYLQDFRTQQNRATAMEWFQWLAERIGEREAITEPTPAYLAHRDWKAKQ